MRLNVGKKFGMQLLDDNLWMNFQNGKISAEEAIDKSQAVIGASPR